MILVHAGNRVDADGREGSPRFPPSQLEFVAWRLARLVELLKPTIVTAAAAGADLLLVEAGLEQGLPVHVVLPFSRERFCEESVADRGDEWVRRYEAALDAVLADPSCELVEHDETGDEAFHRGNALLLEHAKSVAAGEGILALAVRPTGGENPPSVTDDFVKKAKLAGRTAIDIDPRLRLEQMRRAFVAMPFGVKGRGRRAVDCDATFAKLIVPALEDADLAWERADRQVEQRIIHVGMIEQLGNADVVVVDTATENPNVFYELGLRHALADRATVLLGPLGTSPPFDTRPIRHLSYKLSGQAIDDAEALAALPSLQKALSLPAAADAGPDSPVFAFFEVERRKLQAWARDDGRAATLVNLHRRVTEAAEQNDADALEALATSIQAEVPANTDDQRQLLLRVGIALLDVKEAASAETVLKLARYEPNNASYALWAQQLAMALRRLGEEDAQRGENPEPRWERAQGLLNSALMTAGDDPETCGIAGGLAKQRAVRALAAGALDVALAQLRLAANYYERGLDADPTSYYAGLNAVTTLRLLGHRLDHDQASLDRARELLPVVMYFARRAHDEAPFEFWPVVSVAELVLTAHLLGGAEGPKEVDAAYRRAAALATKPGPRIAVRNQLDLYRRAGDPADLLDSIETMFVV